MRPFVCLLPSGRPTHLHSLVMSRFSRSRFLYSQGTSDTPTESHSERRSYREDRQRRGVSSYGQSGYSENNRRRYEDEYRPYESDTRAYASQRRSRNAWVNYDARSHSRDSYYNDGLSWQQRGGRGYFHRNDHTGPAHYDEHGGDHHYPNNQNSDRYQYTDNTFSRSDQWQAGRRGSHFQQTPYGHHSWHPREDVDMDAAEQHDRHPRCPRGESSRPKKQQKAMRPSPTLGVEKRATSPATVAALHTSAQTSSPAPFLRKGVLVEAIRSPSPPPFIPGEPSEAYLSVSQQGSDEVSSPPRKLLILDLNGSLLYRSPRESAPRQRAMTGGPRLRAVHPRPYMQAFREYLFTPATKEWLDTMIWSSAQPHSVADMVKHCFRSEQGELLAVWARDTLGLSSAEYGRKTQTVKNLEKPWTFCAEKHHSAATTLLLDDSPLKAHLQPFNHLCVPEYDSKLRADDLARLKYDTAKLEEEKEKQSISVAPGVEMTSDIGADAAAVDGTIVSQDGPTTADTVNANEDSAQAISEKTKKDRKKKKAKAPLEDPGHSYDETLLAVIGVLDAIRPQSNVAGWIHSRGLWAVDEQPETKDLPLPTGDASPVGNDGQLAVMSSDPKEPVAAIPSDGKKKVDMWFDSLSNKTHWALRGRKALEELGIEATPGVHQ